MKKDATLRGIFSFVIQVFSVVRLSHRTIPHSPRKEQRRTKGLPGCDGLWNIQFFESGAGKRERAEKKNVCLDVFGERPHEVLTGRVLTSDLCGLDTFVWFCSQAFTFKPGKKPNSAVWETTTKKHKGRQVLVRGIKPWLIVHGRTSSTIFEPILSELCTLPRVVFGLSEIMHGSSPANTQVNYQSF